uniref:Uncharacterized protein n=1 Tax=Strigamia maritima TaxID=126957 RepID=T1IIJ1_STRMM
MDAAQASNCRTMRMCEVLCTLRIVCRLRPNDENYTPGFYKMPLVRNALGRVASIGDLYDVRTDTFVGFSIFDGPIPEIAIEVTTIPTRNIDFINTQTVLEKFEKLNVIPELRASILANLITLEGHAKYLENKEKNKKPRKSLVYTIHTQVEKLIFDEENDLHHFVTIDESDLELGTHFVASITWGAKTVVSMEKDENNGKNEDLTKQLRKLSSTIGKNEEGIEVNIVDDSIGFSVQLFSDVLPATNEPKSINEAEKMLKKIPRLVQMANKGKGKPISYILIPIWKLKKCLKNEIEDEKIVAMDQNFIAIFIKLVDEIHELKEEVNNMLSKFNEHRYCIPVETARKSFQLKSDFKKNESELMTKFKATLKAIRSGKLDSKEIALQYNELNFGYLLLPQNVKIQLSQYDEVFEKINLVEKLRSEGVIYVGIDNEPFGFDKLQDLSMKNDVLMLYLPKIEEYSEKDLWESNRKYFFDLLQLSQKSIDPRSFGAIDLCVRPDLAITEDKTIDIGHICLLKDGHFVDYNVLGSYLRDKETCYAKTIRNEREVCKKPLNRIELQLECPESLNERCANTIHKWNCSVCKEALLWGFDGYFYCSCGRSSSSKFLFKCNDEKHGDKYVRFLSEDLENLLSAIPPLNELNILIMGATGVGKSTWINSFINYLAFSSLDDASKHGLLAVTSTKFEVTDENDITHTIRFGEDKNEVLEPGQSATQDVRAHIFPIGNTLLRMIDTPGIGDIRGVEQDKKNFKKILQYLSTLKSLNGICILLKPNESRLNVLFEFCIEELLTHLHHNATKNIVFCFTHSRGTFYKPGDTRSPLGELLWKNKIDLELNKDTMYCMDNESFRFLCAESQGVEFKDSVKKSVAESWNVSGEETNRLISYIKTLKPHFMLSSTKASEEELSKMLFLDIIKLETEPLNHPRTICGANKCVEYHPAADGSIEAVEYITHCHPHCRLEDVAVNIIGDVRLKQCAAMNGSCRCSWDQHLHITYSQTYVHERIIVKEVPVKPLRMGHSADGTPLWSGRYWLDQTRSIPTNRNLPLRMGHFCGQDRGHLVQSRSTEKLRIEQEDEQRKIIEVSVKLGQYLSKNAILPYNDVLERYIDHLIENEKQKVNIGGNDDILKRMDEMRRMYVAEQEALQMAMAKPDVEPPRFEDFNRLLHQLYALKHNGSQLRRAMEQASVSSSECRMEKYKTVHGYEFETSPRFKSRTQAGYAGALKSEKRRFF